LFELKGGTGGVAGLESTRTGSAGMHGQSSACSHRQSLAAETRAIWKNRADSSLQNNFWMLLVPGYG